MDCSSAVRPPEQVLRAESAARSLVARSRLSSSCHAGIARAATLPPDYFAAESAPLCQYAAPLSRGPRPDARGDATPQGHRAPAGGAPVAPRQARSGSQPKTESQRRPRLCRARRRSRPGRPTRRVHSFYTAAQRWRTSRMPCTRRLRRKRHYAVRWLPDAPPQRTARQHQFADGDVMDLHAG